MELRFFVSRIYNIKRDISRGNMCRRTKHEKQARKQAGTSEKKQSEK
jgi:hypothetical protein